MSPGTQISPTAALSQRGTAVVTGAAVRIGRAVAMDLARQGFRTVVHFRDSASEAEATVADIAAAGGQAMAVAADLQQPEEAVQRIWEQATGRFGPVTLLVNNAAIFEGGGLGETDSLTWERLFAVNLRAPYVLCEHFATELGDDETGQIINLVDWRGLQPDPERLAYSLTKHGLVALTKTLAESLAPRIRVNAVAPGPVLPAPGADPNELAHAASVSPLGRTGGPEDVVSAVRYLVDAPLVTGEVMAVAGGSQLPPARMSLG